MKQRYISIVCFAIIFDQIIKLLVSLTLKQPIVIIDNFFSMNYVKNYGVAWSMFNGNSLFIIILSLVGLYLIYLLFEEFKDDKYLIYPILVFLSGALGNIIDRIFRGYVVDYLDFNIFGYDFPVFNIADIYLVISLTLLLILFARKEYYAKRNTSNK